VLLLVSKREGLFVCICVAASSTVDILQGNIDSTAQDIGGPQTLQRIKAARHAAVATTIAESLEWRWTSPTTLIPLEIYFRFLASLHCFLLSPSELQDRIPAT
jgi:hypothetical protein